MHSNKGQANTYYVIRASNDLTPLSFKLIIVSLTLLANAEGMFPALCLESNILQGIGLAD